MTGLINFKQVFRIISCEREYKAKKSGTGCKKNLKSGQNTQKTCMFQKFLRYSQDI